MASFAKIGLNYKVLTVVAVDDEDTQDENGNPLESVGIAHLEEVTLYPYWVAETLTDEIGDRGVADLGGRYDEELDKFISPKPFTSWILNAEYQWEAPITYPTDGSYYIWDEETQDWAILAEQ